MYKRNNNRVIKLALITLCLIISVVFMPLLTNTGHAYAASGTKKMTVYSKMVKKGNIVCVNLGNVLAAVNVKTNKAKILYNDSPYSVFNPSNMKIKGNYLYFQEYGDHETYLIRINIKTGKKKTLHSNVRAYAISGKKIYYKAYKIHWEGNGDITYHKRVMKLNGKSKKKTSVKVKNIKKKSNAKGYKIVKANKKIKVIDYGDGDQEREVYYNYYLQKPNGRKIFIINKGDEL